MNDVAELVSAVPFLRAAAPGDVERLCGSLVARDYPKGNLVFYHGESCTAVCVLLTGAMKVSLASEDGREVVLDVAYAPALLGVDAALTGGGYFGTAITVAPARIAKIPVAAFAAWLPTAPAVQSALSVYLAVALRRAYEKVGEQALMPVKRRLLSVLLDLARTRGREEDAGQLAFVRPTHQELAELVGSSRVVITRMLKEILEEEQAIAAQGNVLRVYVNDLVMEDGFGV